MNPYSAFDWEIHINATINKPIYYLYSCALDYLPATNSPIRVLDIGCGAGDTVIASLAKGWDVTAIDHSPHSETVIRDRKQSLPGNLKFQITDFSSIEYGGDYQLIIALFSLPFGNKQSLNKLLQHIMQHTKPGAVLAINFFGSEHTWAKEQRVYSVTKVEIHQLLSEHKFERKFFCQRIYQQLNANNENIQWDIIDLIAVRI